MDITPIGGSRALPPVSPVTEGAASRGPEGREKRPETTSNQQNSQSLEQTRQQTEELKALATRAGLELRIEQLPNSDVTLVKMVEPGSGKVVREFPPEGLATALAEMRARARRRLDHKA
jgi:uncharacterized FlaG/YvyC family protein